MKNYSDRRDFLKLTAAGAATLTLGGLPVSAGAEEKRTLTVAWDTDIDTLDPASFKSEVERPRSCRHRSCRCGRAPR